MPTPLDVATKIASGVGSLTLGTNCFAGPIRDVGSGIPDTSVFVVGTGGFPVEAFIDGGSGTGLEKPAVRVLVRSDRNDFSGGVTLADSVLAAIDMNPPTGYVEARTTTSDPIYIGTDDTGHHEWSINVELTK